MSSHFDDLARRMSEPMPRRGLLRTLGAALLGGAGLAVLRPLRANANPVCTGTVCGTACCVNGQVCLNASTSKCGCGAGTKTCGPQLCCEGGGACTNIGGSASCCCSAGQTPCGQHCCPAGVACVDKGRGICGCSAGTTPCRYGTTLTCCDAGTSCPPTATCPQTLAAKALCVFAASDINLKDRIVVVDWANR